MTEEFKEQIETEARQAVTELLAQAKLKKGDVFVVGCSSSEIVGGHIGKDSSLEAARAVYAGIAPVLAENGIWLAAQCCEHLNRALIIEADLARELRLRQVPTLSITRLGNNTLASVCDENLYIHSITLPARYGVEYEISTPYFILIEYLYLAYQEFLKRRLDSL